MKEKSFYELEQEILSSFSKQEFKNFRDDIQKEYFSMVTPYLKGLKYIKKIDTYMNGDELEKYFIEQIYYFFDGGYEKEQYLKFLTKIENYYSLHHQSNMNRNFKKIDINSISIIDILSKYITLPNNLKKNLSCPLHKEKTGSFRVYEVTNSFYCFGCHKGGNAVNFIEEIEGISNKEAFKKILHLYS